MARRKNFLVILVLLIFPACQNTGQGINFADFDIVYQTSTLLSDTEETPFQVGLVNSDGTNNQLFQIPRDERWNLELFEPATIILPILTGNGNTLIFRNSSAPGHAASLIVYSFGEPAIECSGDNLALSDEDRPSLENNDTALLLNYYSYDFSLSIFAIDNCENGIPPQQILPVSPTGDWVGNGDLSPDGTMLAYSSSEDWDSVPYVYIYDFRTGIANVLSIGIEPIWSPDGENLAYIGLEGIYIYKDQNSTLIVPYSNPEGGGKSAIEGDWPPLISWSPDSEWLTYHKCILPPTENTWCRTIEDFAIFKVNISTGEEMLVIEHGMNPYWRK
jgi:hypothetical protein